VFQGMCGQGNELTTMYQSSGVTLCTNVFSLSSIFCVQLDAHLESRNSIVTPVDMDRAGVIFIDFSPPHVVVYSKACDGGAVTSYPVIIFKRTIPLRRQRFVCIVVFLNYFCSHMRSFTARCVCWWGNGELSNQPTS